MVRSRAASSANPVKYMGDFWQNVGGVEIKKRPSGELAGAGTGNDFWEDFFGEMVASAQDVKSCLDYRLFAGIGESDGGRVSGAWMAGRWVCAKGG